MWAPALWRKGVDRGYGDRRADEGARRIRRQVGKGDSRNGTLSETRAPDGSGARWAWVPSETRASGETLLALGSSLDEPPFRTACLALWTQDVAGRGGRTASLELRP